MLRTLLESMGLVSCDKDFEEVEVVSFVVNEFLVSALVHDEVLKFIEFCFVEFVNHITDRLLDVFDVAQVSSPYSIPVSGSKSALVS